MCVCYKQYMVRPWSITRSEAEYLEIFDTGCDVLFIKLFAEVKHVRWEQGFPIGPVERNRVKELQFQRMVTKIIIQSEQLTSYLTWNILHWPQASRRTMAATSWRSDRWGENHGWNSTSKSGFIKTCAGQRALHNAWPSTGHAARQQWRPVSQPSHLIVIVKNISEKREITKKTRLRKRRIP